MLKGGRKTQAQAAYEVLAKAGFECFIGSKPHNCHIVSVFSTNRKGIQHELHAAFHKPEYAISKVKGKSVIMLHFLKPTSPFIDWDNQPAPLAEGEYGK